ncbi:hypothetical protein, partial [Frankia sp. AvcI1]
AHCRDVESDRGEPAVRGRGADVARFDVVIYKSMSRIARRMYGNLSVERALERAGVPLLAWN